MSGELLIFDTNQQFATHSTETHLPKVPDARNPAASALLAIGSVRKALPSLGGARLLSRDGSVLWTQCERESLRKLELLEGFGSDDDMLDQFRPQPEL